MEKVYLGSEWMARFSASGMESFQVKMIKGSRVFKTMTLINAGLVDCLVAGLLCKWRALTN